MKHITATGQLIFNLSYKCLQISLSAIDHLPLCFLIKWFIIQRVQWDGIASIIDNSVAEGHSSYLKLLFSREN